MATNRERPDVTPLVDLSKTEISPSKKIFKQFFKSDFKTLRTWAIKEIIIPGIQNFILNSLSFLFYENTASPTNAKTERSTIGRGRTRIPYSDAYRGNLTTGRRPDPEDIEEEYIPDYRNEIVITEAMGGEKKAIRIIQSMKNLIADYGDATVVQFYRLCNITHPDFQMNNWGWDRDAFNGATCRRVRDGWLLMIPEAIYLSE